MRTVKMEKVMVREFVTHGHRYAICKDNEGCFWGFDLSELDENGRLAKEYNGFTGHRSETMIDTMRKCYQSARTENEIDREKLKAFDIETVMKLNDIIDDSYKEIV